MPELHTIMVVIGLVALMVAFILFAHGKLLAMDQALSDSGKENDRKLANKIETLYKKCVELNGVGDKKPSRELMETANELLYLLPDEVKKVKIGRKFPAQRRYGYDTWNEYQIENFIDSLRSDAMYIEI